MARAQVVLLTSATYRMGIYTFTRNSPRIVTDPADIAYFQSCSDFSVTILGEERKKVVENEPVLEEQAKVVEDKGKKKATKKSKK